VGTALGIAVVGSFFFGELSSSRGRDWSGALDRGLLVSTGFVALALVLGLFDLVGGHGGHHGRHEKRS